MPPRMRTQSAGWRAAESLGGGTGEQGLGANRGLEGVNRNVKGANEGAPDFSTIISQQLQNLLPAMLAEVGCSYKEFLACNPKEYDGKGGVVLLTCWIEKMENFCPSHVMQKLESELWNHAMVGAGHAAYTDRFHKLARLVPYLIFGALTGEAVRNGSIKKGEKRGNMGETSKNKNGRDDNKRTRTRNVFSTTVNLVGRENIDNTAKGDEPKFWPACCRIIRKGKGEQVGKGGRGRRPREGNDERVEDLNCQGNDQGLGANGGVEGVNGNVKGANGGALNFSTIIAQQLQNLLPAMLLAQNVGNVLVNGNWVGCSYNELLACNHKEYDGKGGVVVLTRWIEKMENVQDMSGCSNDQKVKYTAGYLLVRLLRGGTLRSATARRRWIAVSMAGHVVYTDRFHKLARLVPHLVTPESMMIERYVYGLAPQIRGMVAATEPKTIQKAVHILRALTVRPREKWISF
ncbi:hypothetical protein Tco_0668616 [Tanacetum coccineum]